ncbi:hypothetical protein [Streptomyces sp. NPDC089919]|uniref:hypothetical protein n=1 Tax=Streptomyces sp. NPDC089919 TaxID=3155188 RepID=UPI003438F2CB
MKYAALALAIAVLGYVAAALLIEGEPRNGCGGTEPCDVVVYEPALPLPGWLTP